MRHTARGFTVAGVAIALVAVMGFSGLFAPVPSSPSVTATGSGALGPGNDAAFVDTFDTAVNGDPGYGLNDSLAERQRRSGGGVTYTRVSGRWNTSAPPRPWFSQVDHVRFPGRLAFFLGHSAVRFDAPARVEEGRLSVAATLTPTAGDPTSRDWASVVLSAARNDRGYVTGADVAVGALVRADGEAQVFQAGRLAWSGRLVDPTADGSYRLEISLDGALMTLGIDGISERIELDEAPPVNPWVYLGRYSDDSATVSTVDDLTVSRLSDSRLRLSPDIGLEYFGYFPARITPADGNHVPEVRGRSNLNWIQISDRDRYASEVLADCGPASCVLSTGNEFFRGCEPGGGECVLHPDARDRWQRLADIVRPYSDRIAAFYLLDEPYWRGASFEDVQSSARMIKETFPDHPVMLVMAAPTLEHPPQIPDDVDWIGFDQYCVPTDQVEANLEALETAVADDADAKLFLFAQGAALGMCNGVPARNTDARIAATQWEYLRLAEAHPRVAGIFAFGVWVSGPGLSYQTPSQLPRTTNAQERIAARILAERRPPPDAYRGDRAHGCGRDGREREAVVRTIEFASDECIAWRTIGG